MLIIVEGLDNTGKTTLIKDLRKQLLTDPKTTSIHCTTPPNGCNGQWSEDHYMGVLSVCNMLVRNGWTVIMDRSHLGEDVFGPIFRNTSADYIYDIERLFFKDIEVKTILLIDDPENLQKREDGNSHSIDTAMLQKVSDRFVEVFTKSTIVDKMVYHVGNDGGFENMYPTVKNFIEQ